MDNYNHYNQELQRLANEISTFRIYLKIFIAGIITSLILGNTLTTIFLFLYLLYEFNIYDTIFNQVPLELKKKYKSKVLLLIKWIDKVATEALHSENSDPIESIEDILGKDR